MEGNEIWKDVPGYEGYYQISNFGEVRRSDKTYRRKLRIGGSLSNSGYLLVGLSVKGKSKNYHIHRLVYLTFKGAIPDGYDINHKNGIRTDNAPDNLECVTHADNMRHARAVLKTWDKPKERNYCGGYLKLTPEDVRDIRRLVANKEVSQRKLAIHYGVHDSTISLIVHRKMWGDVE